MQRVIFVFVVCYLEKKTYSTFITFIPPLVKTQRCYYNIKHIKLPFLFVKIQMRVQPLGHCCSRTNRPEHIYDCVACVYNVDTYVSIFIIVYELKQTNWKNTREQ